MNDPVNHPIHYTSHPSGIECIEITEHMSFCLGSVVKYLWRAGLKGCAIEDLKKARFYLDREIARLEGVPPLMPVPASEPAPEPEPEPAPEPEPTPAPEPAPEPPAQVPPCAAAPAPSGGAAELVTGPYSEAEIDRAVQMMREGCKPADMARALCRDPRGIHVAIARAQARISAVAQSAAAEKPAAPVAEDRHAGKGGIRRRIALHLDGLPRWPEHKDLDLVTRVIAGCGFEDIARDEGLTLEDVRARWQALTQPAKHPRGVHSKGLMLDGQEALLAELRERVERMGSRVS